MDYIAEVIQWIDANWAGVIVASCALFISINQAVSTRKHNRLMVTPHLTKKTTVDDRSIVFSLVNTGIGPAIITKQTQRIDGREPHTANPYRYLGYILLGADAEKHTIETSSISSTAFGCYLAPNSEIILLKIEAPSDSRHAIRQIKTDLDTRFQLEVEFSSIYNEKFHYHSYFEFPRQRSGFLRKTRNAIRTLFRRYWLLWLALCLLSIIYVEIQ